jgi:hypothetical protein
VAEGARLESVYARKGIQGSNPCLSAIDSLHTNGRKASRAIGLLGSLAVSRLAAAFLFGVSPTNPIVYGVSATLILALSLLASSLPARRTADRAQTLHSQ